MQPITANTPVGEEKRQLRESPEMSIKDTPMGEQSGVTYTEERI